MANHLYISAAEKQSGKSLIALALMEHLSQRGVRLGFFRPVIRQWPDASIHLMQQHYQLPMQGEDMYGMDYEQARRYISEGNYDALIKAILARFKNLQQKVDTVVCLGTDFSRVPSAFEFDFNGDVANHLGCLMVPVVNAFDKTAREIIDTYDGFHKSLVERKCDILAGFINRTPGPVYEQVSAHFQKSLQSEDPVIVIGEHESLSRPTVRDVINQCGARLRAGEPAGLNRSVSVVQIASDPLSSVIDGLQRDCLLICDGQRIDVLMACLALADTSLPAPSAVMLMGEPPPYLRTSPLPVITAEGRLYDMALRLHQVTAELAPEDRDKIAAALEAAGRAMAPEVLHNRIRVEKSKRLTPFMFEHDIISRAKQHKQHIVLPEGDDERILQAAQILLDREVVDITLLGDEAKIEEKISRLGLAMQPRIINPLTSPLLPEYAACYHQLRKHKGISLDMAEDIITDVSFFGTMMVHRNHADGMVSGAAHTTQHTIRPAFQFIKTSPGVAIVSSVFFMCLPDRVLVYGDCAVNPNPDPGQLADIAIASAHTAGVFGIDPVVAMLSYSSGTSGKGEDVDRVRQATELVKQRQPQLKVEGPIQYDAAVDMGVARKKMPGSNVAGNANVFIFPDLNTGNNTYKAVQRSAGAVAVGPVLQGLNKPVNDLSRGCLVPDVVNTVAITAIQAQQAKRPS